MGRTDNTSRTASRGRRAVIGAVLVGVVATVATAVATTRTVRAADGVVLGIPALSPTPGPTPTITVITSPTMHGDPVAAARFWMRQNFEDCVPMTAADIIGQATARQPSEGEIRSVARSITTTDPDTGATRPIYDDTTGTAFPDIRLILDRYGVSSDYIVGATLSQAEIALDQGWYVAASVDGERIWNATAHGSAPDRGRHDHSVLITGIDEAAGVVYLNDSGIDSGRQERVALTTFAAAWSTSDDSIVVAHGTAPTWPDPTSTPTPIEVPDPTTGVDLLDPATWPTTPDGPLGAPFWSWLPLGLLLLGL